MINIRKGGELAQAQTLCQSASFQVMTEKDKYFMVILTRDPARCLKSLKIL
jgi:hypothetical protein